MTGSRPAAAVVVVLSLAAAGCGGGSHPPSSSAQRALASSSSDFGKDYSTTTCPQFRSTLTPGERTAAATIALVRLRSDAGLPAPRDTQVEAFVAGLDGTCEARPDETLAQAAAFAYRDNPP